MAAVIGSSGLVADDDGVGFVAKVAPIPVRQLLAGSTELSPRKFLDQCLLASSSTLIPNVEILVRQVLMGARWHRPVRPASSDLQPPPAGLFEPCPAR